MSNQKKKKISPCALCGGIPVINHATKFTCKCGGTINFSDESKSIQALQKDLEELDKEQEIKQMRNQSVFDILSYLFMDFTYYDRKNCEYFSPGELRC